MYKIIFKKKWKQVLRAFGNEYPWLTNQVWEADAQSKFLNPSQALSGIYKKS